MDITYRHLGKITIVFLTIFFAFCGSQRISSKSGFEKKLAVYIETSESSPAGVRTHYDIALSLKNLLEFKLCNNKVDPDIFLMPKKSLQNYHDRLHLSDYYGILVIHFSISDKQENQSFQRRVYKKQQPDFSLIISSTYSDITDNGIVKQDVRTFEVSSQPEWFEAAEGDARILKKLSKKPEPIEYVIQRAVEILTTEIPIQKQIFNKSNNVISAAMFVDSSFIAHAEDNWLKKYESMMLYSSRVLNKQFSHDLDVKSLITADIKKDKSISMHRLFRNLKQYEENLEERLVIYLINNNDREDYFLANHYDNIGLAEIGRKQILINEVPAPTLNQTEWQAMYNALTLLHEVGHTFGAVHVSDKYSIMNHNLTWIATNQFDSINKKIVDDAMNGHLLFVKKEDYLQYVTNLILASDYYLVDIPSFYYNFFKRKSDSLLFKSFSKAEQYKPFLYAASGYGYLEGRQFNLAENEFKKALEYLPTQASLYYYLYLCSEGDEAEAYLEKAYRMGYYLAEVEYLKQKR